MVNDLKSKNIEPIPQRVNDIATDILSAAFEVHTYLGPGLLESVYTACLIYELQERGYDLKSEVIVPIHYKNALLNTGLRLDVIVEDSVIVEVKAIAELAPIHQAQILTYLKLTGKRVGYLLNFNTCHLKDGIKRIAL